MSIFGSLMGKILGNAHASEAKGQRAAIERAARNHPIQGTNGDILKRALALLYQTLPESVHLILCVHDEIVLCVPEHEMHAADALLTEAMEVKCLDVDVLSDGKIGYNLADMKDPNELKKAAKLDRALKPKK